MYESWEKLEGDLKNCKGCKLCQNRNNIVIGEGNKKAKIMFIGEGPGADEDLRRKTIYRKSGKTYECSV